MLGKSDTNLTGRGHLPVGLGDAACRVGGVYLPYRGILPSWGSAPLKDRLQGGGSRILPKSMVSRKDAATRRELGAWFPESSFAILSAWGQFGTTYPVSLGERYAILTCLDD